MIPQYSLLSVVKSTKKKKAVEKAEEQLDQLRQGKRTINEIRTEYGLSPIECGDILVKIKE